MKSAIIAMTLYQTQGADRLTWQQAEALSRKGDEVSIFTFSTRFNQLQNIKLIKMGMPAGFYSEKIFRICLPVNFIKAYQWVPRLKGFDIVYAHGYPASWFAYLSKIFFGVKYIHYFYHINTPGFFPGLFPRIYTTIQLFFEKITLSKADGAITISEFAQQQLTKFAKLESKVIYPQIDCIRFQPDIDRRKIRDRYDIGDAPLVLFVGGISPQKCIHLLINAFKILKIDIPNARLLIVGKFLFDSYTDLLKQMSDDSVVFSGELADEDIPYCYAACDVYVSASRWEGFNLPLAEAQACGRPVVAFNIGPHPEVMIDEVTGFLVPELDLPAMAEKIELLLCDEKLKNAMGKAARGFITEKYSENQYLNIEF
ncbi:MAG: glycosyltransferase family 4 protein [Dehalococcoidia bacterium]|nr:glycosyltransferase family 4 protein [Dehalococcoidia bacterium]MDD5493130.1 glycosyltransferase family 4 protein [Dehalococcoidia bacterium]